MKKFIALLLCGILTATALTGCGSSSAGGENGEVIVYNWGEYIDPDTITMFEKETGIKVVYDEFETNEIMYPKVEAGSSAYDVVCPSDYMVQKMIENDLIQELDYDKIPNAKENIGASDATFRATDIHTGKVIWTYTGVKGYIETKPLVTEDKVIFGA